MASEESYVTHEGGCHCGAVKFQVKAPAEIYVFNCNCTICNMKQNRHFIVPQSRFTLLQGADNLTTYTFNTHRAKHMFCKTCGVQSFYQPRTNPDGYGVMPHCVFPGTITKITVENYDGQNWEESLVKQKQKPDGIEKWSKE